MVYHGILWESMGIFSIFLTVRIMFWQVFAKPMYNNVLRVKKNVHYFLIFFFRTVNSFY